MTRQWDPRLDELGVRVESSTQAEFRLVEACWADPSEANDKHHIYVRVQDRDGAPIAEHPFRITNGGERVERTKGPGYDDYYGNSPMFPGGHYTVDIPTGRSDKVTGIRPGTREGQYVSTCFYLVFQRDPGVSQPEPQPEPQPGPTPGPGPMPEPLPGPTPQPGLSGPKLDPEKRARLLALLDQAQAEINAARKLLESQ